MRELCIVAVLLLLPAAVFTFFTRKQVYGVKRRAVYTSFSIVVCAAVLLLFKMLKPEWIWHEYVFIVYVCAVLFVSLFNIFVDKKKITVQMMLVALCLIGIGVASYSILTIGQVRINSDTACATMLAQSQIRHKSIFPDTWAYGNGELWFLSLNLFVLPFTALMENQSLARQLASLMIVLAAVFCIFIHDKKMFKSNSWVISIPVFLIFMKGTDLILDSAAYTLTLTLLTASILLAYEILYEGCGKWVTVLFVLLNISACINSIRYLAEITVPLWLACTIMLYFESKDKADIFPKKIVKRILHYSALAGIPALIGYGIVYQNICKTHIVSAAQVSVPVFISSIEDVWDNIAAFVLDMFVNFGFSEGAELFSVPGISNMISVSVCLLMVFIVPVLQVKKISEETKGVQFFFAFMVSHNLIFAILGVFFGWAAVNRYMLSSEYLMIVVSARYIMKYWIGSKRWDCRTFWTTGFIFASLWYGTVLFADSDGWVDILDEKKHLAQELVDRGLDNYKGYATYWNAYENEIYSDLKLSFAAINFFNGPQDGTSYLWLVDTEKFIPEDKGSFLMLTEEENELLGEGLEQVYGNVEEVFSTDRMYVYVWGHDIAQDDFKGKQREETDYLTQMELSGAVLDEETVLYMDDGQYIFGPYLNLEPGMYKLILDAEVESGIESYITSDLGSKRIKNYKLKTGRNEIVFGLDEFTCQVEFPIYSEHDDPITIHRIILEDMLMDIRTDYTSQMHIEYAQNVGEKNIYIPQNAFIYGPYIRLGQGRYSLNVDTEMEEGMVCKITSDAGTNTVKEYRLRPGHNEVGFELKDGADDIEFFIQNDHVGTAKVKKIELRKK